MSYETSNDPPPDAYTVAEAETEVYVGDGYSDDATTPAASYDTCASANPSSCDASTPSSSYDTNSSSLYDTNATSAYITNGSASYDTDVASAPYDIDPAGKAVDLQPQPSAAVTETPVVEVATAASTGGYGGCKTYPPYQPPPKVAFTANPFNFRSFFLWPWLILLLLVVDLIAVTVYGVMTWTWIDPVLGAFALIPFAVIFNLVYMWKYGRCHFAFIPESWSAEGKQQPLTINRMLVWILWGIVIFFLAYGMEIAVVSAFGSLSFQITGSNWFPLPSQVNTESSQLYILLYDFFVSFVVASFCEELVKYIAATAVIWLPPLRMGAHVRDSRVDCAILSLISAGVLATIENQSYMVRSIDELPAIAQWSSVGSRMVLAVPFHCFTGLIIGGLVGRYTHWGQSVWVKIVHILWLPIVLHGLYDFFLFLTTDEVFRKDLPFFAILGSLSSVCVFIAGVRALHILRCNNKEDCREDEGCGVA